MVLGTESFEDQIPGGLLLQRRGAAAEPAPEPRRSLRRFGPEDDRDHPLRSVIILLMCFKF